ncbi:MAG: ABC-2 family transporter protein, partial [Dermatophilaceae bacterium]
TVSFSLVELSRFPVQAYRQPLQTVLVVVPVALLTTVPAEALLGRLPWWWLVASPSVAVAGVGLASVAWRASLRRYTGASA